MPENFTAPVFADDRSACDLVIDTFDQMHNMADMSVLACHVCIAGGTPVAIDAVR